MRESRNKFVVADRVRLRAFTLIELLIVVAILGILAAVVVPRFSDASHTAKENALKDDLRYLRTQVVVFKAQHRDAPPGYPGGGGGSGVPTESDFIKQMTERTNELAKVGTTAAHNLGPYVLRIPANPVNGRDTVKIVGNGKPMPAPDGLTGWIYKPQTLEVVPNCMGVDSEGRKYADY